MESGRRNRVAERVIINPVRLMRTRLNQLVGMALLALLCACSNADRDRAREREAEAKQKVRRLGNELRQDARRAASEGRRALTDGSRGGLAQTPDAKIRDGEQALRTAGGRAAVKLSEAAVMAQVKANLGSALGLSALADIGVAVEGQTVTLTGRVSTEQEKEQAAKAAAQVPGTSHVVNRLRVEP